MIDAPSPNGGNGDARDAGGRFAPGWKGGPGNPHAARVAKLRAALLEAITPAKIKAAVKALIREAEGGNIQAIRELLDRSIGRPVPADGDAGDNRLVVTIRHVDRQIDHHADSER